MVRSVALVTLGCARNEVDSEELAARLASAGWRLAGDRSRADLVLVNTCGFVDAAKKDSIDNLLAAADGGRPVVAVGCLAERYGATLAKSLPEVAAVLSFDDYPALGERLTDVLEGRPPVPHVPRDRRLLLPLAPAARSRAVPVPGLAPPVEHVPPAPARAGGEPSGAPLGGPRPLRLRLRDGPVAALKIASGCDRRCTFCAIPSFRGAFVSRPPQEILAEAEWLASRGVRELVLTSENSTSYGKDLGDLRALEKLLPELARVPGVARVRVSYLQPAELRPSLVDAMTGTPGVAAYFDLSFQHASAAVLRRMRRFGDGPGFLGLLDDIRARAPRAGVRTNVIVGFPGERRRDVGELVRFLTAARCDAVGVFGYSREAGTAAARLGGQVRSDARARRQDRVDRLVQELMAQRAEQRVGEEVQVLVQEVRGQRAVGQAEHQGPGSDGQTVVRGRQLRVGQLVPARVVGSAGVDLVAVAAPDERRAAGRQPAPAE